MACAYMVWRTDLLSKLFTTFKMKRNCSLLLFLKQYLVLICYNDEVISCIESMQAIVIAMPLMVYSVLLSCESAFSFTIDDAITDDLDSLYVWLFGLWL